MTRSDHQPVSASIGITVLGATGSIGVNTLDVIARHPRRYHVFALSAHTQVARLVEQCRQFEPRYAVLTDTDAAEQAQRMIRKAGLSTEVLGGAEALDMIAAHDDTDQVMAAIVGAAGLQPTLAAARAGKRILLANKESLVMSGQIFMDEVRRNNAQLLPIDSEHNAIFQSMPDNFSAGLKAVGVEKIMLTASGGPFREHDLAQLQTVTPEQACDHPRWKMGRKISVDSASMMNKGLEVIEACWLFAAAPEDIQVVIHPQSVIHSLVSYADGSVLAQLGNPDMRTPIAHAMAWPERISSGVRQLDLFQVAQLDFQRPDLERFPCLRLAYEAMRKGGTAPAVLNAANEVAVAAFLAEQIPFTAIPKIIESSLAEQTIVPADSFAAVLAADAEARGTASALLAREAL